MLHIYAVVTVSGTPKLKQLLYLTGFPARQIRYATLHYGMEYSLKVTVSNCTLLSYSSAMSIQAHNAMCNFEELLSVSVFVARI